MKLWIANTTKKEHQFTYRFKGQNQVHDHLIRRGQQKMIGDFLPHQATVIIKSQEVYGMVAFDTLSTRRGFSGLCYRQGDEPIDLESMMVSLEINDRKLAEDGKKRRLAEAINISKRIGEVVGENVNGGKHTPPVRLEVVTVEADTGRDTSPGVADGVEVIPERYRSSVRPNHA